MSTESLALTRAFPRSRRADASTPIRRALALPELLVLLLVAGVLNLWDLSINGYANTFYAAAVKSMASSWHDFLFASMDKAGLMTIDKPPLAYWVQALVVRVFGYSSWSLLVPQALMGVAAVVLMYDLVRRRFGRLPGFIAGLALATTPTIVAVSRHNNPDELLTLLCVAAVWFALRALETGRTRDLVWCGVMIGLGFETKMGVALMIVPPIALAWLWIRPSVRPAGVRPFAANLRAFGQLLWGGLALAVVGLAWPILVTLTPAADRPWISGTSDNSVWSLITGYNGLGRISGQEGGPSGAGGAAGRAFGGGFPGPGGAARAAGGPGGGAAGGGNMFGGSTGPFRLLNSALGDQAGWLLGMAVVALIAMLVVTRLRRRDPLSGFAIVVGGSLVVVGLVFSFASGIFHPYYVSVLAPWLAALIGAGVAVALSGGGRRVRIVGPALLLGGAVTELVVLHEISGQLGWAEPLVIAAAVVASLLLVLSLSARTRAIVLCAALAALAAAPATWAAGTLGHAASGTFPLGGPASVDAGAPGGGHLAGSRRRFFAAPGAGFTPPAGGAQGFAPAAGGQGFAPGGGSRGFTPGGRASRSGSGGVGFRGALAGGGFGGDSQALAAAAAYASGHGGGIVAVESQSEAAQAIMSGASNVAGIGGFSGRESSVSVSWLAMEIREGRLRWLLGSSSGTGGFGLPGDNRTGSASAIEIAERVARKVSFTSNGQRITLYELQGRAGALLEAARGA